MKYHCETQISYQSEAIATGIRGEKWCFVRYCPIGPMTTINGVIKINKNRVRCCRPKKVKIKCQL